MLTYNQYIDLWTKAFPYGLGQTICPPCYHEYLQREIYQQDYLDLFGVRLAETFKRTPIGGRFYVEIAGVLVGLGIPTHPNYVINHSGRNYLLVDYDFPFNGQLNKGRNIKYLMIGEAAPPLSPTPPGYNLNDRLNSYFYNKNHTFPTGYFTAPCTAFGIRGTTKPNKLIELAKAGVYLVDLFPFATSYNFRDILIQKGVVEDFWGNHHNPYSMAKRLSALHIRNIKTVLIAPLEVSSHIAVKLNNALPHVINNLGLNFRMGKNTFIPVHSICNNLSFIDFPKKLPIDLVADPSVGHHYHLMGKKEPLKKVPIYSCCASSGSGFVPHELFIRNALGLT